MVLSVCTAVSVVSRATSAQLTCHPESMVVSLTADEVGFGLSLQGGATEYINYPITISSIEDSGPAARSVSITYRI